MEIYHYFGCFWAIYIPGLILGKLWSSLGGDGRGERAVGHLLPSHEDPGRGGQEHRPFPWTPGTGSLFKLFAIL